MACCNHTWCRPGSPLNIILTIVTGMLFAVSGVLLLTTEPDGVMLLLTLANALMFFGNFGQLCLSWVKPRTR